MKRSIFIGDIHGCYDEMMKMLDVVHYTPGDDSIYFTGDLINKGPDSIKVVQELLANPFQYVMGNHEAWLLNFVKIPENEWTEKQKRSAEILGDPFWLASIVKNWPLWIDTPQALLVHAGIEPGKAKIEDMDPNVLLSVRTWDGKGEDLNNPEDPAWFECVTWPKTVIFGHWAAKGLVDNVPGFIGLDSGCVYGKYLSAYCLEERKFYSVPAARPYSPIKKQKRLPTNA